MDEAQPSDAPPVENPPMPMAVPVPAPRQPKDWIAWRKLLPALTDPGSTGQMESKIGSAKSLELLSLILIVVALVVALVALITNVEGSGIPIYIAIFAVFLVAGLVLFFLATSMSHNAITEAKNAAMQQHPDFFMPDGLLSDVGMGFLQSQGLPIES